MIVTAKYPRFANLKEPVALNTAIEMPCALLDQRAGLFLLTSNGYIKALLDSDIFTVLGILPKRVMGNKQASIVAMEFLVKDM